MLLITLLCVLILSIYFYVKYVLSYWKRRNIPTSKTTFLVGNMSNTLLGRENFSQSVVKCYNKFKNYKYIGFYKCLTPALILNDPELIGRVMVQDFEHFEDNTFEISEKADVLMSKNLFALKGHHWRSIRNLLTPMFASGKLKLMYPLMLDSCKKLVNYLDRRVKDGQNCGMDGKYLAHQFTTENVANCAFGVEAKAFENEQSEFVEVARVFGKPSSIQMLKINIIFLIPILNKIIAFSAFAKHVQEYIINVITKTLHYRKENNIIRNDFLDMFSQLKETSKVYKFKDKDVAAQAASFVGDGIETSSIVLSYSMFEVASHPEVQDKLRTEIKSIIQHHNNQINYDALMEMAYLDCIIKETMRLNTTLMILFKTCTKTYQFPPPIEGVRGVQVNPGDSLLIPLDGIHNDERFYDEPEKFQPERFDDKNKDKLHKYTYFPFGQGPRICIGLGFGNLQIKAALAHIILNFRIKVNKKMQIPLKVEAKTFLRMPIGGFWFDFEKI